MSSDDRLRYPIGAFKAPDLYQPEAVASASEAIASLPARLRKALAGRDGKDLLRPYRPQGWTGLQVLHHMADSHINGLCRTKLALTEDQPVIRPYEEQLWALLPDYDLEGLDVSLDLLQALHAKWSALFSRLTPEQWQRTFVHPASGKVWPLYQHVAHYAWHGDHHLRHIEIALAS